MERSTVLNITFKSRGAYIWVRYMKKISHEVVLGRHINRLKDDRWIAVSPLGDIIRQEKTTKETSQVVERRPGHILRDTIWRRTAPATSQK